MCNFKTQLVSVAEQTDLSLNCLQTPKTGFVMTRLIWSFFKFNSFTKADLQSQQKKQSNKNHLRLIEQKCLLNEAWKLQKIT